MLLLARQVSYLTTNCFDFFLQKWKSIRPRHLGNSQESYWKGWPIDPDPWDKPFECHEYEPSCERPLTRVEASHIELALWGLQLAMQIKGAAIQQCFPWTVDDVGVMNAADLIHPAGRQIEWEGIASAEYYVQHQAFEHQTSQLRLPAIKISGSPWPGIPDELGTRPGFGQYIVRSLTTNLDSTIRDGGMGPFRPWGIGIWCNERLSDFELCIDPKTDSRLPNDGTHNSDWLSADIYFMWKSFVSRWPC